MSTQFLSLRWIAALAPLLAISACGGSSAPARGSSRTAASRDPHRTSTAPSRSPQPRAGSLASLVGSYQPAGEAYPRLELRADASYVYTTGSSPEQSSRGEAMLDERVLTLTPNVVGGTIEPIEIAVRTYSGRTVLLRGEQREAFDLVPSSRLGLLSRIPSDPPDAISIPDEPQQPNPAGPGGATALPSMLLVRASFPATAEQPGLRVEVAVMPHRVELSGCETRTPNRECGGIRRRTLGVGAWLEINRLWWATFGPRSCTEATATDSSYAIQIDGGETRTGVLPPSATDPTLQTPCGADARIVYWLASQLSLR
ncbi:MAG: hypothetical protein IT379_36130 [Deltaproteobacteria bacterium]|nr:hypothetical protein [Deltaproteobacteria bacterium]